MMLVMLHFECMIYYTNSFIIKKCTESYYNLNINSHVIQTRFERGEVTNSQNGCESMISRYIEAAKWCSILIYIKVKPFSAMCDSTKQLFIDIDEQVAASIDGKMYLISPFTKYSKLKALL